MTDLGPIKTALLLLALILAIALIPEARAETCAKVIDGKIATIEGGKSHENCLASEKDKDGNPIWRPYIQQKRPSHDSASQHPPIESTVIGSNQVTRAWSTPIMKTAEELDADKEAFNSGTVTGINKAVFEALCRLENHDRVSDGKAAWTKQECLDGFKGLLP